MVYDELKTLWQELNIKYILHYEKVEQDNFLFSELLKLLNSKFSQILTLQVGRKELNTSGTEVSIDEDQDYNLR